MKPSDVVLAEPVPLIATFDRCESEVAAAYLLLTMVDGGDTFRPVPPEEVGETILRRQSQPGFSWLLNPFAMPDFHGLVGSGFARIVDGTRTGPLEFTEAGLERLRASRWRR